MKIIKQESDGTYTITIKHKGQTLKIVKVADAMRARLAYDATIEALRDGAEIVGAAKTLGGIKSEAKARAARDNGKLGGRPRKTKRDARHSNDQAHTRRVNPKE